MDTIEHYKIFAVTHKHTPLKNIGQFVLSTSNGDSDLHDRLSSIADIFGMQELLYLATCNRVLYFFVSPQKLSQGFKHDFLSTVYPNLENQLLNEASQNGLFAEGAEAVSHLFEVASSMDSLVVGEREILRQLREAYDRCLSLGTTDDHIRLAMRYAVETAKKIYSDTRIGEKPVSVVSLAVRKLMVQNVSKDARVLIVGAGQTNNLVSKFLTKHQFHNFTVFNRTLEKAQQLANTLKGKAYTLDELENYTGGFDILVVCTGATNTVITPELYQKLLVGDTDKKVLIDLAVPNNIDKTITEEYPCTYIEIESLRQLANQNLAFREKELLNAKAILEQEVTIFESIFKERQIEKALSDVPKQIKAIKKHAMDKVFRKELESLDHDTKALMDRMLSYMERRCIAIPIQVAKENLGKSTAV